jgi:hypothetical protein
MRVRTVLAALAFVVMATAVMLLVARVARADEPSEEDKKLALMLAYQANGNSMSGWGNYDFEELKHLPARVVQPVRIDPPPSKAVEQTALSPAASGDLTEGKQENGRSDKNRKQRRH